MLRIAMLSVHTCPLAALGGWETGGMNVYLREISRQLSALGLEVDVYTRRQDPALPQVVAFAEGARVIHIDAGPPSYLPKETVLNHLPQFVANLQQYVRAHALRYDLIHAHYWLSGRVAAVLQPRWRVPVVAMFHTLARMKNRVLTAPAERESAIRAEIEQRTMTLADRVVATSAADRRQMLEHYLLPPGKISVVPGGVDRARFRPRDQAAARQALGLQARKVVLFVGRIQRLKGIDLLLRAVARLVRAHPALADGLRVLIVGGRPSGDGPERQEFLRLSRIAARLGISRLVDFVGAVDQERLPLFYAAADVTVIPSLYESFGLVAVESMACGTPVVAARVGGLTTTVQDGQTGYLIPWRDPVLYAERIAALLTDEALRRRLGERAVCVAARYDWALIAEEIYGIYCGLVRCERRAAGTGVTLARG
ncbi:MAG TPA: glycosyltransferase [Chloroflexota bacterium]|nr:glycosyltransferase [Chloroflexota bacterium]HZU04775.1 glycosyltransferase [Chloroflexota bacterium]